MNILVTGASGFVGVALTQRLRQRGQHIRAAYRTAQGDPDAVAVGDIGPNTDWGAALEGVEAVVHLAGIAHARAPITRLAQVNIEGVRNLAAQADAAGVKRFVFLSSIKAGGESSGEHPLTENTDCPPSSHYGRAKRAGEEILHAFSRLRAVSLRPPLIFGPGAKANAKIFLQLCDSPAPLPFGKLRWRRSYIGLSSLLDAIEAILATPLGPPGVFYVADQPSLTLTDLAAIIRQGLGRAPSIIDWPPAFTPIPRSLRSNFEVDDSAFRSVYFAGRDRPSAATSLSSEASAWKAAGAGGAAQGAGGPGFRAPGSGGSDFGMRR